MLISPWEGEIADIAVLMIFSALAVLEIVKMTTVGAASGAIVAEVTTFPFRCEWQIFNW